MKKKIYSFLLFVAVIILINPPKAEAQGVGNHVTMSLENCTQPLPNTLEFDLMIMSDGVSTSDLRMNSVSYGVNFNTGMMQPTDTVTPSYIPGTTDTIFHSPSLAFPVSTFQGHIRITQAPFSGGNTGVTMVIGHQYRAGRIRLTNTSNWVANSSPNFSLQSSTAGGHTTCEAILYIGTSLSSTSFFTTGTGDGQRSVSVTCSMTLNPCGTCPPVAYFQSNNTTICTSSCINFTDLSTGNPTGWQWFFPGATPDTSTQQNPTNICYNTAGTYPVTLLVSNSYGTDTLTISPYITAGLMSLQIAWLYNASCGTCNDGTAGVGVVNGVAPVSITWYTSPIQNGDSGRNLLPGTYTVCAIDGRGCTACTTVHIDSMNCSGFAISTHGVNATCSTCSDGSTYVGVVGGIAPYTYSWNTVPVQTTDTATALSKGTYSVCVADHSGCTACDSATVGVGYCRANYNLYPDTTPHTYTAVNTAIGAPPITYLWSWGDGGTDTAAYPQHTYATAGHYTICLSIADFVGCTSSYCDSFFLMRMDNNSMISVNVVSSLITGVGIQNNFYQAIKLFPNPTNGSVTISYSLARASDVKIEIYNSVGQQVDELTNGSQAMGKQEIVFDSKNLSEGIYFVKVIVDGNTTVLKMARM